MCAVAVQQNTLHYTTHHTYRITWLAQFTQNMSTSTYASEIASAPKLPNIDNNVVLRRESHMTDRCKYALYPERERHTLRCCVHAKNKVAEKRATEGAVKRTRPDHVNGARLLMQLPQASR